MAFRERLEAHAIGRCFWTYKRLDTDRSVVSIERTPEWDAIVAFAEHPRATFKELRKQRPSRDVVDPRCATTPTTSGLRPAGSIRAIQPRWDYELS